ncbi:MAG: type II secretion system F family protein [Elusimicrobiota bacterium]
MLYEEKIKKCFQQALKFFQRKGVKKLMVLQQKKHLSFLVLSLKSGASLAQSLRDYVEYAPHPLKSDLLQRVKSVEVNNMKEQIQCLFKGHENQMIRAFLNYSYVSGAPVSSKINSFINAVKQKEHFVQKAQALSAQTRVSAWIIGVIPFIFFILFSFFYPEYLEPLFKTLLGRVLLFLSLVLSLIGLIFVQKLGRLE